MSLARLPTAFGLGCLEDGHGPVAHVRASVDPDWGPLPAPSWPTLCGDHSPPSSRPLRETVPRSSILQLPVHRFLSGSWASAPGPGLLSLPCRLREGPPHLTPSSRTQPNRLRTWLLPQSTGCGLHHIYQSDTAGAAASVPSHLLGEACVPSPALWAAMATRDGKGQVVWMGHWLSRTCRVVGQGVCRSPSSPALGPGPDSTLTSNKYFPAFLPRQHGSGFPS